MRDRSPIQRSQQARTQSPSPPAIAATSVNPAENTTAPRVHLRRLSPSPTDQLDQWEIVKDRQEKKISLGPSEAESNQFDETTVDANSSHVMQNVELEEILSSDEDMDYLQNSTQ